MWLAWSHKKKSHSIVVNGTNVADRNTLIDAIAKLLCTGANEAVSVADSFLLFPFFSIHLVSSLSLCVASFTLMGCLTYTSHGCANAKYVGRNFLFVQRFSDTLPAFGGATTVYSRLERRRQRGTERCLWETFLASRHVSNHCVSSMLLRCRVKIFRLNFQFFFLSLLFSLLFFFLYFLYSSLLDPSLLF